MLSANDLSLHLRLAPSLVWKAKAFDPIDKQRRVLRVRHGLVPLSLVDNCTQLLGKFARSITEIIEMFGQQSFSTAEISLAILFTVDARTNRWSRAAGVVVDAVADPPPMIPAAPFGNLAATARPTILVVFLHRHRPGHLHRINDVAGNVSNRRPCTAQAHDPIANSCRTADRRLADHEGANPEVGVRSSSIVVTKAVRVKRQRILLSRRQRDSASLVSARLIGLSTRPLPEGDGHSKPHGHERFRFEQERSARLHRSFVSSDRYS